MTLPVAPNSPRPLRRPRVVAAAIAVGIAPWGCGGTPSAGSDPMTRPAAPAPSAAPAGDAAAAARAARLRSPPVSHTAPKARRVAEFRRWIVLRFRIAGPARPRAADEGPLDQLRRSLGRLYGP